MDKHDFSAEVLTDLRLIRQDIRELREELQRTKGFIGGMVWCFSAAAGLVGFVWGLVGGAG